MERKASLIVSGYGSESDEEEAPKGLVSYHEEDDLNASMDKNHADGAPQESPTEEGAPIATSAANAAPPVWHALLHLLPPKPPGKPAASLVQRVQKMRETKASMDITESILSAKHYRNPSIYAKLVTMLDICETGTNFPPEKVVVWAESDYSDAILVQQRAEEMGPIRVEPRHEASPDRSPGAHKRKAAPDSKSQEPKAHKRPASASKK